jgi:hypothetical protein
VFVDAVRHEELGVLGPAQEPLGRLDPFRTERLAVGLRGVLDRRAVADVAVDDDQRREVVVGILVVY